MTKFQIILLCVFGAFIVVAVALFSLSRGRGPESVTVTVWGDISSARWNSMVTKTKLNSDSALVIRYIEKATNTLESEFTEALAVDAGPDLIIMPLEKLWQHKAKLSLVPFQSISERDFKAAFIEEGELFLTDTGIYALPLYIDPMVLYYNRDLLSANGVARPMTFWDEAYNASLTLTDKDQAGNITKAFIALGEAKNIPNSKDILSMLILQAGAPITQRRNDEPGGILRPALSGSFGLPVAPTISALDFYTQFANPARAYHSWNRSLLSAQTHFAAGDSAYYLGFASELPVINTKSPTLNFAITVVPQSRVSGKKMTFGRLYGLSLAKGARNPSAALSAGLRLVSREINLALSQSLSLPPTRRDLLSERPSDAELSVFYDSALISRGWLDPDDQATETIFHNMIESVTSGRSRTSEAIGVADRALSALLTQ